MRAAAVASALLCAACAADPPGVERTGRIGAAESLRSGSDAGFARATEVRPFVFPDDHGVHPEYRTEWWYFTGNLGAADGSAFGFQWTVFRHALEAKTPQRASRWGSRDVWFAHFAVGDERRGRFHAFERFERGALGLAGARARPFAAWVGDWRAQSRSDATMFPLRLVAERDGVAIDLELETEKPFVPQGDDGLSQKGPEPGNASYYYSATRLTATGTVTVDSTTHTVDGSAWLDREWSTSALSEGQLGWDWFSIQLDDGRDLMFFRIRQEDGAEPFATGSRVDEKGDVLRLGPGDVRYTPGRRWASPRSGSEYPVEWRLRIESLDLELEVWPLLDDSEMDLSVRYWEGAIRVRGSDAGGAVSGVGFLEMTGY